MSVTAKVQTAAAFKSIAVEEDYREAATPLRLACGHFLRERRCDMV